MRRLVGVHLDRLSFGKIPGEDLRREWILNAMLNDTLERTRPVRRVVTFFRE